MAKLGNINLENSNCIYLPSKSSGGSSTPDEPPSTLEFILIRSSFVKSPLHILFRICPYSGSSLKRCSLSKMITALMQFSQCLLERFENRSSVSLTPMGSSCEYSHDLWAHNLISGEKRKKAMFFHLGKFRFWGEFSFVSKLQNFELFYELPKE